jgi:hypothetical protein
MSVFGVYETTINCQRSPKILKAVMEEAVDRYLALHHNVFPLNRQDSSIKLKVQKSYLSSGEIINISIQKESFKITSRCIEDPKQAISISWGKNRNNVAVLSNYLKEAIQELTCNAA